MSRHLLVFSEILERLPRLGPKAEELGFEVLPVMGGREALDSLVRTAPRAMLLDVAMPQMSGIEACRRAKESAPFSLAILIFSSHDTNEIRERALAAGCDLFTTYDSPPEKWESFLQSSLGHDPNLDPKVLAGRAAPRVTLPVDVGYTVGATRKPGRAMNASRSGVLIATEIPLEIDTPLVLHVQTDAGKSIDVKATVVRTVKLKEAVDGLSYAAGAKFIDESEAEALDWVLLAQQSVPALPKINTDFARKVLEGEVSLIMPALAGEDSTSPFLPLAGEIHENEKKTAQGEGAVSKCVARFIFLRVQCTAFRAFIPVLKQDKQTLSPTYLPLLSSLLERSDAIESEAEEFVRQAVTQDDETTRQVVNVASNRLHQARTELLFAVFDQLSPEGLGPEVSILTAVEERVKLLRSLRAQPGDDLKYRQRAVIPPKKTEEKKPDQSRLSKALWIPATVLVMILASVGTWKFLSSRVEKTNFETPLAIRSAKIENEISLVIYSTRTSWKSLDEQARSVTFGSIENYMKLKRLKQAKIIDETETTIAAIMTSGAGKTLAFQRRRYIE